MEHIINTFSYKSGGQVTGTVQLKAIISECCRRGLFFQVENAYHGKRAFYMVRILPGNRDDQQGG